MRYIKNVIYSDKNQLFYGLLIFLGLRRKNQINEHSSSVSKFADIVTRKIIHKENFKVPKTPRNLMREVYKRKYHRDLSPNNSPEQISRGEVKININLERKMKKKKKKLVTICLSWCYTSLIFLLLCVQPSYAIYHIVHDKTDKNFMYSSLFFVLIPPTQYIFSVLYFSTSHFEEFYLNKSNLDPKCFPNTNQFTILIILISLLLGVINFLFLSDVFTPDRDIPEILTGNKFADFFIEISAWVYGRFVIYVNLLCFSLVFCKHCKIIHEYVKKLENENLSRVNILSINIISQDILFIRNDLEQSIDHFKNIFSLFTLLGAIGLGFFFERIKDNNFDLFPWNQFVIYVIAQIVFIVIIFRVSKYQNDLIDYVRQPLFVEKFLKRYTIRDVQEKFEDPSMISLNLDEENSSMLDWIILDRLLNEKWAEFNVAGIDISDGELIKKGIAFVAILTTVNSYIS